MDNLIDSLGEGCGSSMGTMRVFSTKTHATQPRQEYAPSHPIRKRSYKRAIKRVQLHGFTWYQGQLLTSRHLPTPCYERSEVASAPLPTTRNIRRRHSHGCRYSCLTWNVGGLTRESWDSFNEWLTLQDIDIILLQESHWKHTSEWLQGRYFCLHSGGHSHSGVLTMISKSFCNADNISWADVFPGRILHTRLYFPTRALDIVNVYQFVNGHSRTSERASVWTSLHSTLNDLPSRNLLVLGGDFNTSLSTASSSVGISSYQIDSRRQIGPFARDEDRLTFLLTQFDLVALNTWTSSLGPTFQSTLHSSRIDFLLTRRIHADSQARNVAYLQDMPLLPLSGPRHFPMLTTLTKLWFQHKVAQPDGWTFQQRCHLRQHWQDDTATWQAVQSTAHEHFYSVSQSLQLDSEADQLEHFHGDLSAQVKAHLVADISRDPVLHNGPSPGLKHLIAVIKQLKQLTTCSLSNIFQCWSLITMSGRARLQMKAHSKARRQRKRQDLMMHAKAAADSHDQYQLFKHIRSICPKAPKKLIRLRDEFGNLLGPEGAAEAISLWLTQLYHADTPDPHQLLRVQNWPFTEEEYVNVFREFRPIKALTNVYAPAIVWKENATVCASALHLFGQHWSAQADGQLPDQWSQGTLVFLPKPHKRCHSPCDLRPISLLEPTGKATLSIFAKKVTQIARRHLIVLPQYAYMADRTCTDAISRVLTHIDGVKHDLQLVQYRHHQTACTSDHVSLWGGLMLSLDLSKAFDMVNRSLLLQALSDFGVPDDLTAILHQIYSKTTYVFEHRGIKKVVPTRRGIRQGCQAAPCLWIVFLGKLMHELADRTSLRWLQDHNTTYADDWILHQNFYDLRQFKHIIRKISTLFQLFREFGLEINFDKTVILLRATGSDLMKMQRRYIHRTDSGTFLKIPTFTGDFTYIRLVHQHTYLGVKIGYGAYQNHTVLHRLTSAKNASFLLSKWLRGRGGLTKHQRACLWNQCILTSLLHALGHVGLSQHQLSTLDSWALSQLRHIFQEPIHLELVSHKDFLQKHGIKDPLLIFRQRVHRAILREEQRQFRLDADDILHSHNLDRTKCTLQVIDNLLASRRLKEFIPQLCPFQCIYCSTSFASSGLLRRHYTSVHGQREGQLRRFDPLFDPLNGLPTCRRCNEPFTRWQNLEKHVEMTCLFELPQDMPDVSDFQTLQSRFLKYAHNGMENLEVQEDLLHRFLTRCSLCNQFHNSPAAMKNHWCTAHPTDYAGHDETYTQWIEALPHALIQDEQCLYCHKPVKQNHDCIIIRNLALLATHHDNGSDPPQTCLTPEALQQCSLCLKVCKTAGGLQMHMAQHHDLPSPAQFVIERDVIPGSTACSHCGRVFESMTSMARHIKMQLCTEFDPTKESDSLMTRLPELRDLVVNDDCTALLQNSDLLKILAVTCSVCQQEYKHKGNLVHHINSRHGELVSKAASQAIALEDHHRGSDRRCFCPDTSNRKQARTHKCIAFLQFAMLQEFHRRHHTSELADVYPAPLPMETDSPHPPENYETLEDDSLAIMLQQAFDQEPPTSTDPVAAFAWSDSLNQTVVKTLEGMHAIDLEALSFMDMPSYSRDIPLNNAVLAFTHSSFLISTPRTLDHVAKGDYLALWKDLDALHFMSRRCVCCGASFSFESASKHIANHWGDITNLPDGVYPDCASKFFANFLALPWFQNTPCYRAVLHQVLILRLLIDLWEDGTFGCGNAGDVEECLIRRRVAAGLQASQDRPSTSLEKKSPTSKSARSRSRSRNQSGQDVESLSDQARGHVERAAATAAIHPPLEGRDGIIDPPNDEKQHGMASGQGEVTVLTPLSCQPSLHHADAKSTASTPGETGGRDLSKRDEKPADHRTEHLPLPDLVPEVSAPNPEQGQSSGEGGTPQATLEPDRTQCMQRSYTQVSRHEESTSGPGRIRKQLFPMDAHDISHDVSSSAAIVLSQRLATRGCGCEEAVSVPLTSSQANRSATTEKTLRCCLNPEGLFCWLNAASLGLCWLGLVCDCSTSCWSISWLFDELTRFTPQPLTLRQGDSTFHQMLREWAEHHLLERQQDVADFLAFCLPRMQPAFYSAEWMPQWAFRDGTLLEDHQEKGTRFAPLMFHVNDPIVDQDLQSLVNHWHDANGHARVLNEAPPGLCIHLSRLVGEVNPVKSCKHIDISSHVALPCFVDGAIKWHGYTVTAISHHLGPSFLSGHWRTIVWQGMPWNRWPNYDDGTLPDISTHLPASVFCNWCVVWLALEPRFD